jgi:homogentisate 1,2-dioxygenase
MAILIIPRGMIYQIDFDTKKTVYVESLLLLYPKRYKKRIRTTFRAFSFERDFILPNELETHDEKGDFLIKIKKKE